MKAFEIDDDGGLSIVDCRLSIGSQAQTKSFPPGVQPRLVEPLSFDPFQQIRGHQGVQRIQVVIKEHPLATRCNPQVVEANAFDSARRASRTVGMPPHHRVVAARVRPASNSRAAVITMSTLTPVMHFK